MDFQTNFQKMPSGANVGTLADMTAAQYAQPEAATKLAQGQANVAETGARTGVLGAQEAGLAQATAQSAQKFGATEPYLTEEAKRANEEAQLGLEQKQRENAMMKHTMEVNQLVSAGQPLLDMADKIRTNVAASNPNLKGEELQAKQDEAVENNPQLNGLYHQLQMAFPTGATALPTGGYMDGETSLKGAKAFLLGQKEIMDKQTEIQKQKLINASEEERTGKTVGGAQKVEETKAASAERVANIHEKGRAAYAKIIAGGRVDVAGIHKNSMLAKQEIADENKTRMMNNEDPLSAEEMQAIDDTFVGHPMATPPPKTPPPGKSGTIPPGAQMGTKGGVRGYMLNGTFTPTGQ